MSRTANLVIKLTAGLEAPERVSQAFSVASAALASGVNVSFWLTGDAAYFAVPGKAAEFELPHAANLSDQLASLVSDGRVVLFYRLQVPRVLRHNPYCHFVFLYEQRLARELRTRILAIES